MERLTPSEWQRSHHSVTLASCCQHRAAPSEGAAAVGRILPWLQNSADQAQITRVAPLYSFKPQLSWIPKHVLSVYGLCNLEPILTFILGCKELLCQLVLNWAGLRGSFFNVVPYYWPFWCYPLLWCNYCLWWSTHGQSSAAILADFFVNLSSYLGSLFFFLLGGRRDAQETKKWKVENYWVSGRNIFGNEMSRRVSNSTAHQLSQGIKLHRARKLYLPLITQVTFQTLSLIFFFCICILKTPF